MNTQIQDLKKIFRIVTIILIIGTLLTPFIFSGNMFFPYIASKAFFMRFMIVLSSISYIGLALIDKNSRPKKSQMLYAMSGFVAILILATINSVNPTRSMWSNFERMEGLVTILYMMVLFVISSATLRKREWPWLMNSSIVISIIVGLQALGQDAGRIFGHLGNSSYLGIYALIHVFFGILGALMVFRGNRERELMESGDAHKTYHKLKTGNYVTMGLYVLVALFNAFILFKTGTRGAFVGLVVGLILSSIYFAWKEKNKTIRFGAIGFLVAVLVSVVLLGTLKNTVFIKENNMLSRFSSLITTDVKSVLKNQGEARTMIWRMAYEGVKERPLLGWGQDNFGYVFAKYYNPQMYAQEQWFDRSHNVFMDWLVAGGILGLVGYLSLFATALYFLFSKKAQFTIIEKSILLGLLAAYFVHNMFVFDNLSSYVLFFLILAYINDRYTHDRHEKNDGKALTDNEVNKIILIGVLSLLAISYISYHTILKPYTQNSQLIKILKDMQVTGIPADLDKRFTDVMALGPTGRFEAFEQFSTTLPKIVAEAKVPMETKQKMFEAYEKTVAELDKTLAADARYNYFVSSTYRNIGLSDKSMEYINKAYALSPQKQSFAYNKAILLLDAGKNDEAIALLKKAYEDAPQNITAYGYYVGTLSEEAKKNNYNIAQMNVIAELLVEGYQKYNYDIIFKKEFWSLFTDLKAKTMLVNRISELMPDKKAEVIEASK